MADKHHTVRVQIDQHPYDSPDPTTGAALYALGNIAAGRELYRDVHGGDDELVPRDDTRIDLKNGEHFFSQKAVTLIVNGEEKAFNEPRITFDQVVKLAYPVPPPGENIMFLVNYRHGPHQNPKGTLLEGQSVQVKNRMIFDVTPTDRS